MLHNLIRQDLKKAMKNKDLEKMSILRVIIGEFPRLNKKVGELPTDDEVLKILKSLKKNEELIMEKQNITESKYLTVVESYLPKMMTKDEIKNYIDNSSINLTGNIGAIMSRLMKELKGKADGNIVRKAIVELSKGQL